MIAGFSGYPHSLRFAVIGYTLVNEADYARFADYRWGAAWNEHDKSYIPFRHEKIDGKHVHICLAREVLNLPRNPGRGTNQQAVHRNNDTLDNRRTNLFVATNQQAMANRRVPHATSIYYGVCWHGRWQTWEAVIRFNNTLVNLASCPNEHDAAFAYNHASALLHGNAAVVNSIPEQHLPTQEDQTKLLAKVEARLRKKGLLPPAPNPLQQPFPPTELPSSPG